MNWDGHVHTPFCPHGSTDPLEDYIERAIARGIKTLSFTEHAPLPESFTDPTPEENSAMAFTDLEDYLYTLRQLKYHYAPNIDIRIGLEVDYIEGYEREIEFFLDQYGPELDDALLSVHFLKKDKQYFCLDYSSSVYKDMIDTFGGLEPLYDAYFRTLLKSVNSQLGFYKPTRIGHLTLVTKFQKKFAPDFSWETKLEPVLKAMHRNNYAWDWNTSGLRKKHCGLMYPDASLLPLFSKYRLPYVLGSDAHTADDIGSEFLTAHALASKHGLKQLR
ncbi:MAG: histidinol-phosphatase HisJ [Bacilli bacterium]